MIDGVTIKRQDLVVLLNDNDNKKRSRYRFLYVNEVTGEITVWGPCFTSGNSKRGAGFRTVQFEKVKPA